jgi:hypothetical protein
MEKNGEFKPEKETQAQKEVVKLIKKAESQIAKDCRWRGPKIEKPLYPGHRNNS